MLMRIIIIKELYNNFLQYIIDYVILPPLETSFQDITTPEVGKKRKNQVGMPSGCDGSSVPLQFIPFVKWFFLPMEVAA